MLVDGIVHALFTARRQMMARQREVRSMAIEQWRPTTSTSAPADESPPGVPRWVKVFGASAGIVILLVVVAMILIGGRHGPGRHLHGDHAAVSEYGH